jgi:hypothetical protein
MKIYEFSTWFTKKEEMYAIRETEVEEKPKTYVAKGIRINKEDIDKLQNGFSDKMYRLDNDPKPYIEAMIKRKKHIMEQTTERLKRATADFNKWFDLRSDTE